MDWFTLLSPNGVPIELPVSENDWQHLFNSESPVPQEPTSEPCCCLHRVWSLHQPHEQPRLGAGGGHWSEEAAECPQWPIWVIAAEAGVIVLLAVLAINLYTKKEKQEILWANIKVPYIRTRSGDCAPEYQTTALSSRNTSGQWARM